MIAPYLEQCAASIVVSIDCVRWLDFLFIMESLK